VSRPKNAVPFYRATLNKVQRSCVLSVGTETRIVAVPIPNGMLFAKASTVQALLGAGHSYLWPSVGKARVDGIFGRAVFCCSRGFDRRLIPVYWESNVMAYGTNL